MAYQSLYRRYRPQKFAQVRGQDHLVRALRNAVVEGRVGHAYLFSGPRGTGKTSTARILAKVLNCEQAVDGEPCGVCDSCQAIEHGSSFDVFELDAASNNGVEAIRQLIERAQLGSPGRTKVYILDEVHMLSTAASNALLKTLEEPPDHVVFVLATTDPQKVLPTIKSRTQHFEVQLLSAEELHALAEYVVVDAGLDVTPEAIDYVVRVGAGSARDMESALDQVAAAGGIPDDADALDELVEALCDRDTGRALLAVEAAINTGRTPRVLGESLISRLRDIFLAAMKSDLSRLPARDHERVMAHADRMGAAGSTRALEVLGDAFVGIQDAPDPRIAFEVALVRLTKPEVDHSLEVIVERLERLERGLGPLGSVPPAAPHTATHAHIDSAESAIAGTAAPSGDSEVASDSGAATRAAPPAAPTPGAERAGGAPGPAHLARQHLAATRQAKGAGPATKKAAQKPSTAGQAPSPSSSPPPRRRGATSATSPAPPKAAAEPVPELDESASSSSTPESSGPSSQPSSVPASSSSVSASPSSSSSAPPTDGPPTDGLKLDGPADAATGGPLPSRDDLTLAWGDTILSALSGKAKSRFAAGRFVVVEEGVAHFGLPNSVHANRCLEMQGEVEAALSEHFGVAVPIKITVDGDAVAPTTPGAPRPSAARGEDEPEEALDMADLVDAESTATSSVDRIAEVFPGVEVVDDQH